MDIADEDNSRNFFSRRSVIPLTKEEVRDFQTNKIVQIFGEKKGNFLQRNFVPFT